MAQWHELVVDLRADTVRAQERVDGKGEVEGCTAGGHCLDFALGGEHEDLGGEEVQLDSVEEVHRIGLRVVEDILDGTQPLVELVLVLRILALYTVLVFPVGSKTLFGHLVHTVGTNLYLDPFTLFRHQRDVQRLIAVGLRMTEPVAQTVGVGLVDLTDGDIDIEALVDFLCTVLGGEDDADSKDVVNLIEGDVLVLHLVPDGVGTLHTLLDGVVDTHAVERLTDGGCKLGEQVLTGVTTLRELTFDGGKLIGVFVLETQVLEFRLDRVQTQTVGQRCVDIERLTGNLILFVGWLRLQGTHIMQTVGNLDEDHTDIVAHRQQQLLEVLCLCRCLLAEDAARDLRQSVDNLGHLRAKDILDILCRIFGIFHHVVEEGRTDTRRAQSDLLADNLCHRDGVHDIRLT